jgi:O-acetyl-ADP-ribose deacetylase (regulator of RNase III)
VSVVHATGDLFDPTFGFDAIAHGVNCKGVMGSGIAVVFKNKYPEMYSHYAKACKGNFLLPGQVIPWRTGSSGLWVYNVASQYWPGAYARQEYLKAGLQWVRFHMEHGGLNNLGLPRIGAGIGGLTFDVVRDTVEFVFGKSDLNVTIVSLKE